MMPAGTSTGDGPDVTGERVPGELRGTWVGDELTRAVRHIDTLNHAIETLQHGMRLQQEEIARLSDHLQAVDGRSQRHEAGVEATRGLRQEITALQATLDAETDLRRDLVARIERGDAREAETERELRRVLEQIATQLQTADERQASLAVREQHLATDLADTAREERTFEARIADLEARAAAGQDATRGVGQEIARVAGAVPELLAKIEDLAVRMRSMQEEQRRVAEEVTALRGIRDREAELLDLLDQQRATRARVEDRLTAIEEQIEAVRRDSAAAQESLALAARDRAGDSARRARLEERLEAQRDTVTEHLRRVLRAEEERAQRHIEEIERDVRVARSLLVRLDEQAGGTDQEQPL